MKIPLRKLVVILVTVATFSWVANLMASNPPDPRLEGLDLTPAQQAQVQRALLKVHERARERNQATCQRFEELLTADQRQILSAGCRGHGLVQEPPPPERGPAPPPPPPPPPPERGPAPPPPPPERGPAPPPPPEGRSQVMLELTPAQCARLDHLSRQDRLELKADLEQALDQVQPRLQDWQSEALLEIGRSSLLH